MAKHRIPDETVNRIMAENGIIIQNSFVVEHQDENSIRLLVHKTRDSVTVTIDKGDREWKCKKRAEVPALHLSSILRMVYDS